MINFSVIKRFTRSSNLDFGNLFEEYKTYVKSVDFIEITEANILLNIYVFKMRFPRKPLRNTYTLNKDTRFFKNKKMASV